MRNCIRLISFSIVLPFIIFVLSKASYAQTSKVIDVAGGESHSVALKDNGTVWAWGENSQGQLGDGTIEQRLTPVQVIDPNDSTGYLTGVIAISSGGAYGLNVRGHTLALKQDGTVWGWGNGYEGQLGDGEQILRSTPVQVKHISDPTGYLTNVVDIGAGDAHSLAVKEAGTVWAWGNNSYGQLGDGTKTGSLTAVQVTGLSEVALVAAGENHSIALKQDKTVWAWGNNSYGQLGDGTWTLRTTPFQVVDPTDPSGKLTEVIAVAAGGSFTLALKSDGTVRAWGYNLDGRLGDGTSGLGNWKNKPVKVVDPADPTGYLTGIKAIAAGDGFSMALKQDGTVRTWGYNGRGQLGDGTLVNQSKPVQVTGLSQVVALEGGYGHALAAKADGTVWAWGGNWAGQLGDGTTEQRTTPVQTTFPIEEIREFLQVRGPFYFSSGEEVTLLVQYENISKNTLQDSVIVISLPLDLTELYTAGGGIYRDDRHEIFWKLGNVVPGQAGNLSVKLATPWGLSAHAQRNIHVLLAARNIKSVINVEDYLNYPDVNIVSYKDLTLAEINTLLSTSKETKDLMDHSIALGYLFFDQARQYDMSDGSSFVAFPLLNPEDLSPVLLWKIGQVALLEKNEGKTFSLQDLSGGYSLNIDDGSLKSWGTWAEAHSTPYFICMYNCMVVNSPRFFEVFAQKFSYEKTKILSCITCRDSIKVNKIDKERCGMCASKLAYSYGIHNSINISENPFYPNYVWRKPPGRGAATLVGCYNVCSYDSNKYECSEDREKCCRSIDQRTGEHRVGICTERCWTMVDKYNLYYTGYGFPTIRTYCQGNLPMCVNDNPPYCIDDDNPLWNDNYMKGQRIVNLKAHDPNEKSVDIKGHVVPAQKLNYMIDYENVGEGTAYGVFILDKLDPNLDETTLVINDGGSYSTAGRLLGWEIGSIPSGGKGSVTFSVNVKNGLPSGTEILNFADIYFPSVPEITPTNPVVSIVKTIAADPKTIETMSEVATSITLTGRDSGSNPLTYKVITPPLYGTITGTPPNISYTSMDEFSGQDEFYYVVNNGIVDSDPARVIVRVNPNPADTNPPEVVSTYPKPDTINVHISDTPISTNPNQYIPTITATFSEPIDSTTITSSTFTIGGLTGSVVYDEVTRTASFIPSIPLAASTTYTARLSTGIKDKVGNPMASEYSWQFTTESPANISASLPDNADKVNFGNVIVNSTSSEKIVSLQSTGTLDLILGNINKTGPHIGEFAITDDKCSGKMLKQFENCTLRVAFQPGSTGMRSANLSIPSNDSDTPTLDVLLMGSGMKPQHTLTVNKSGTGGGTVTGTGISCGSDCSETFDAGTEVTLTAAAVSGSVFAGWSGGGCSGKEPCKVTMNAATTVTATFEIIPYQFVINPSEGTYGTKVTITGSGFGTKPGKVLIGTMALKIENWVNDTIRGILLKVLLPGPYDVTIKPKEPKGVLPIIEKNFFTVRGAEIQEVEKAEGSAWDQVTVKGKFFGNKTGKVYLEYEAGVSVVRKACKAIIWKMDQTSGESEIVFVVPKILAAVCDVVVDPYGILPVTEEGPGFTVKAPEIISVNPGQGSSGNQVTITGKYLGTKPGKVYLGYEVNEKPKKKSCQVLSWPTEQSEVGDIVFVVPTGLSPDLYDLIVTNSVGSYTMEEGFKID